MKNMHNKPWRAIDLRVMRRLASERKSARQAAKAMGRTTGAVKYKAMVSGIRFHAIEQPRGIQSRVQRRRHRKARAS